MVSKKIRKKKKIDFFTDDQAEFHYYSQLYISILRVIQEV